MPDHQAHATRIYNGALCFWNARLVDQSIKTREQLIQDHPKDPLARRALFQIAATYHQLADYSKAATFYERFAKWDPGDKLARTTLEDAYAFRIELGEAPRRIPGKMGAKGGIDNQIAAHFKLGELLWRRSGHLSILRAVSGECSHVASRAAGSGASLHQPGERAGGARKLLAKAR
jgi:tetratricopeptide (TPR) repeat protein